MSLSDRIDILLVDDREDGLIALDAVLGDQGYNLVKASSGREALGLLPLYDFALILLDVQMPELDGFETAHLIRQQPNYRSVPILFSTAINKDDAYVHRGYEVGAVDYLFKPFDPGILKAKVAVFVDLHKKNRQLKEQASLISQIKERERVHELTKVELESLRRYQMLANAIPHLLWKTTVDGMLIYSNQVWHDYTGLTSRRSDGALWHDVFDKADLHRMLRSWIDAMAAGSSFTLECRIRRHDHEGRWHRVMVVPEKNAFEEVTGWIVSGTDIHDLKMTESMLLEAREAAESASRAKTYFLANMSHEIRTPLNAILGFSELMMNHEMNGAEKMSCLATIRRNGQQLVKIIDEILDISKVEAGRLTLENSVIDLRDLFNDLSVSLKLQAQEKGLRLEVSAGSSYPQFIRTDPVRLRQILINIVGNAVKFTEKGGVDVGVSWRDEGGGRLHVEVDDTGIGIDAGQAEKLFNPFVQADSSTTRRFGGTGLGLALSRRLARALGGDVWLAKSSPEGSRFVIEIPAVPRESSSFLENFAPPEKPKPLPPPSDISLDGVRVLLVEDAIDNQILISRLLEMAGARVDVSATGEDGVRKALHSRYDVILMDIQMPEMDGYEATSRLRRRGYSGPIIALTAHALKEEREKSREAGCDDHLTKPIDRRTLLGSVAAFARHGEERKTAEL